MSISSVSSASYGAAPARSTLSASSQIGVLQNRLRDLAEKLQDTSASVDEQSQAELQVRAQAANVLAKIKALQEQQDLQTTQLEDTAAVIAATPTTDWSSEEVANSSSQRFNDTALGHNVDTYA